MCLYSLIYPALGFGFGNDLVSSYLTLGKSVGNWIYSVGSCLNWYTSVKNQQATTIRGNLTVSPTSKANENDVLHLKWKGKVVKTEWAGNACYVKAFQLEIAK